MDRSPSIFRPIHAGFAILLASLAGGACSCDEDQINTSTPGSCEPTFTCPQGFEYRLGGCRAARCQVDTDCCPGQKCNAAAGLCVNLLDNQDCQGNEDCQIPGQRCIDMRGGQFCGYPNKGNALSQAGTPTCLTNLDCDLGRTCFNSRCVTASPCEGGCPEGFICDIDTNSCYSMPACTEVCAPGQMQVVADPDTMSGPQCCELKCKCETLPPVATGQFGWYASLAMSGESLLVSAYDASYGDLVVASYDQAGVLTHVEYVDGFPTSGAIVGNPLGARGGRGEPGPKIGEHTSIATDAMGVVHVAYYDREQGALKYANLSGGLWKTMVVDDAGNTGYYTSIAIAPDGTPQIAYMMIDGTIPANPTPQTALKLASSRTNLPAAPSDWTIELVDSRDKPPVICGGGCARSDACVDLGMGPVCVPTTVGCGTCGSNEACVQTGTTAGCVEKTNAIPLDDLVEGTGLFASLAFTATGTPVIAYYDRLDGDLRLAQGNGTGGFTARTLDGNDPMTPTDVGQHVSLAIGPGDQIAVAYFDASQDDLVYAEVGTSTIAREVVDDGVTPPDLRMVGADASLLFDEGGRPAIAYQDPTNIDLLYARRLGTPAMWSTEVLRGGPPPGMMEGTAGGFYVDQLRRGTDGFVVSVDVGFSPESDLLLTPVILPKRLD